MILACLFILIWQNPMPTLRSKDAEVALAAYREALRDWAIGRSGPTRANAALNEVEAAVQRRAYAIQDPFTKNTEWRIIAGDIFDELPQLPPEHIVDGKYLLTGVRFALKPDALFVRAIRFRGTRTMRLHSVTLFFKDGSKVTHALWAQRNQMQGEEFPKEKWTPHLPAYLPNEKPQARRLMSIEVIGTAQDKGYKSELEIQFEIPKPEPVEPTAILNQIAAMRTQMQQGQRSIPELTASTRDLETLIYQLGR